MDTQYLYALLSEFVLVHGVSGNEARVAEIVERRLIEIGYQKDRIKRDSLGNRWIEFGDGSKPLRLLVAHMDEIGFRITSIRADGLMRVVNVGGLDGQLYEGAPVVVHTSSGDIPGAFSTLSHHVSFRSSKSDGRRLSVEDLILDIGATSAEEVHRAGIHLLDSVTFPKRIEQLTGGFVQARSLDDRFGCAALIALAEYLFSNEPLIPTVVAWSVQEEVGLRGARALAERFKDVDEAIAIDSFTVGSGPRDNKQFDAVKPGSGAVLRAFDTTTLVPDVTRKALLEKAASLDFKLQYGYMPGGNDASMFEVFGSRVFGFSVPVVYSHTAAERISMHDLASLIELLCAWSATDISI